MCHMSHVTCHNIFLFLVQRLYNLKTAIFQKCKVIVIVTSAVEIPLFTLRTAKFYGNILDKFLKHKHYVLDHNCIAWTCLSPSFIKRESANKPDIGELINKYWQEVKPLKSHFWISIHNLAQDTFIQFEIH